VTPAVRALKKAGTPFELLHYEVPGSSRGAGLDAADALGVDPAEVFKTLIAELNTSELVMALVPVAGELDLRRLASAAGARSAAMAEPGRAERATGYVTGGISPLGQRRSLRCFIDNSADGLTAIHVSGGRRGLELKLTPDDLVRLTGAELCALTRSAVSR
jgi:Cys-tRNA(Pro)/Cys-tRNA(Cys) deacylase